MVPNSSLGGWKPPLRAPHWISSFWESQFQLTFVSVQSILDIVIHMSS